MDEDESGRCHFTGESINPIQLERIIFASEHAHLAFNKVGLHTPRELESSDENPHSGGIYGDKSTDDPGGQRRRRQ